MVDDLFSLGRSSKKEKIEEYKKRKKLHLFWGAQFTNDGSDIILLYRKEEVKFIYKPAQKRTADKYEVSYEDFCKVFDDYIKYCDENHLL